MRPTTPGIAHQLCDPSGARFVEEPGVRFGAVGFFWTVPNWWPWLCPSLGLLWGGEAGLQ